MQRREFTRALTAAGLGSAVALPATFPLNASAQGAGFESGRDYLPLKQTAPVETPAGQIEVVEFFSYYCPHCNAFEPTLEAWSRRLPKDVVLRRVPVAFVGPRPETRQRLFYALEALGKLNQLHAKVFRAVHVDRQRLEDPAGIADWLATQGVDKKQFTDAYNSFSVAAKVGRANQLVSAYQVDGVPALGVAGRYYTDASLTRSMERSLQVVDFLAGEVKKGR
ncbi:thiol:disulfide interchange protein DsbA/DsbL [Hylemonella gracilis]|uniref:Thiol:disulfide interchange protein n=1 Tax=Hylemonella gracilis TaxID=80880 RepID=A0A4P6UFZ8_9BURK|nr:thiol:disulfide interchange protein DsbA/DsbL [Hylemonella gracilis]QBK04148.1 thiol:disulfide interchange protein DsbA/DsbL [Hylemonella gracilis]